MNVAIVGAGISGLAAARRLKELGIPTVLFEKSKGFGGRCSTRRIGPYIFDSGTSSITPRNTDLAAVMLDQLDTAELVKVEKPIFVHESLRVSSGGSTINTNARYVYQSGNTKLAKLLGDGLEIRFETPVDALNKNGNGNYGIFGEVFDGIILTPPIPQTMELLMSVGESRPFSNARFRSCLAVLLGFELPAPDVKYHALLEPEQRHPLTWLSLESVKCAGRAPDGHTALVAQLSASYSATHFESTDHEIIDDTLDYLKRLYGQGWDEPAVADVKRWRYSQPEMTANFDAVNAPGSRLLIAGDGVSGARIEFAYMSGIKAANMLAETLKNGS